MATFSLIDTHCHLNMMVKGDFDRPLTDNEIQQAQTIVSEARSAGVYPIINVGTSIIESKNCIVLAQSIADVWASVGIHPNDCTSQWKNDIDQLKAWLAQQEANKIVAIGECGFDFHYPNYDKQRQYDVFKAQIELALAHHLPLIVHTRTAAHETLMLLEEYRKEATGVIHCFSEDITFAQTIIGWEGFSIGIGGTVTYPKNDYLRHIVKTAPLEHIVLETDAPFLPPQSMRGKQNHPRNIALVADYIATLRHSSVQEIAHITTTTARTLFGAIMDE